MEFLRSKFPQIGGINTSSHIKSVVSSGGEDNEMTTVYTQHGDQEIEQLNEIIG